MELAQCSQPSFSHNWKMTTQNKLYEFWNECDFAAASFAQSSVQLAAGVILTSKQTLSEFPGEWGKPGKLAYTGKSNPSKECSTEYYKKLFTLQDWKKKRRAHLYLNILLVSCPGIAVSILFHGGLKCQTIEFQCFRSANVKRQNLKMKVACGVQ